ncbi:MAG: hypothetical protein P5697_03350 [Limnospira sp. PMC 1256.20]|uniref:hypothetical protein n=1 Tax=Limnospira sp. PMC 1281.21 TaxID=2981064 RepID=UPI00031AF355|nr:hypothetical protein [Limnospira sp. PMC 1281.21]MDT9212508.1 hypothetical protein [Limnospira sp. PMC 1256.20]MDT9227712.1 hypothetical protein [Limnospira sp. PMC 1242.20]MDT9253216.1 hypothetical protein [Limnospira sp. PMC 1254.20]QNH55836.1 MAG: hypothetical protein H2674_15530 [Limnospira indica BM01]
MVSNFFSLSHQLNCDRTITKSCRSLLIPLNSEIRRSPRGAPGQFPEAAPGPLL